MSDNRICQSSHQKENICIDTYRVLDSCRDKDCFENVKVYLTEFGEEIIDRTSTIRTKDAKITSAYIDVTEVPFNRGFYQLNIKIYVKLTFEACVSHCNIQEFDGIAVVEKRVILFGSEGNVNVFKSTLQDSFCCENPCVNNRQSNMPTAVLEAVDPVVLGVKVVEPRVFPCCCCCMVEDIPEDVCSSVNGRLSPCDNKTLVVSLGFFSVVRIQRPAQIIVSGTEYCIPEKECIVAQENDPCALFKTMAFPVEEFCPPTLNNFIPRKHEHPKGGCGCQ